MQEGYLFNLDGENVAITPHKNGFTLNGINYISTNVMPSPIEVTDNFVKRKVNFTFPIDNVFALRLLNVMPQNIITVVIFRDENVYYKGRVINIEGGGNATIQVSCDGLFSNLKYAGLLERITVQCRHRLYMPGCGVNPLNFTNYYNISGIDSQVFNVSGTDSGSVNFSGGIAKINNQSRGILVHSGSWITLEYPFDGTQSGTLALTRGCQLTVANCKLFNNYGNFGGFSYIPHKNPFSETGAL